MVTGSPSAPINADAALRPNISKLCGFDGAFTGGYASSSLRTVVIGTTPAGTDRRFQTNVYEKAGDKNLEAPKFSLNKKINKKTGNNLIFAGMSDDWQTRFCRCRRRKKRRNGRNERETNRETDREAKI